VIPSVVFFGSVVFSDVIMDEGSISQPTENSLMMDSSKEAALLSLMDRTGYSMVQENGQRKFGGPPPGNLETAYKITPKLGPPGNLETAYKITPKLGPMNNLCMGQTDWEMLLTSSQIAF